MSSLDERPFPKAALIGAGLLMFTTVAGVGSIQLQKHFAHTPPSQSRDGATAVQSRDLRFVDQQDGVGIFGGHVLVFDAQTGAELPQLRESDGFVRAILNSLAFERTKGGIEAAPVFTLVRWSDKRITITDKATGALISLGDFGPGNKSVFLRFFMGPAAMPSEART